MKKNWVSFACKLGEVKENLFTVQGSPFYFIPQNKDLLFVLAKWKTGTGIKVHGYRLSENSSFYSVGKVLIDKYQVVEAIKRNAKPSPKIANLTLEAPITTKLKTRIFKII